MSTQLPSDHSDDEQWKKKKSAEFAAAIVELADEQLGKKKTVFAIKVLEHARNARQDDDPGQRSRQGTEDLLSLVRQLDETHKKTSKSRRASDFLKPFVDGVTRYSGVVDTMVQSDPTVSALVWGGVKFVLQLAVEFSQHYENLTNMLETLGDHLRYLGDLSAIFDWSEELCNILIKSYKNVLLLLEAAADAYSQSGLRAVLKGTLLPFDRKYKHLMQRLEKNLQSVRDSVSAAQSYMLKKQKEDNEKRKLNEWLRAPMTDSTFRHCIDHKYPTTCQWLFTEAAFEKWEQSTSKNPPNDRIIWIYGPPGIGKTFLASSVIQRLQEKDQEVIFYYFRDEKSGSPLIPGKGEALSMLRNLARQLVDIIQYKRRHRLPTGFWDIYERSGGTFLSDIELAVDVIHLLLAVIPRIHIVIDGLDECVDRLAVGPNGHLPSTKTGSNKRLPIILERLTQSKCHGTVKWCFTGCPESELLATFDKLGAHSLKVTEDNVRKDVIEYVTAEYLENLEIDAEDDEAFLSALIRCMSSANFLDARLTMELLRESGVTTRAELLDSIWLHKEGFTERYYRGLCALASKPKREKELARRMLTLVTMAERPLTRNELLDILAVQPGSDVYSCDWRPKPEKFDELLAPLLELDRSDSCSNPVVRFIHRTAKEFMEQSPDEMENIPPECRDFFATKDKKHDEVGKACLAYLTRESFGFKSADEMEKALCNKMDEDCNSLLKYASIFWYHHLSHTSPTEALFRHVARFMESTNFLTCVWVQSQWAPYQMTRYTTVESKKAFHIEDSSMVYPPSSTIHFYYADPLPGWLSEFNDHGARLVQSCQLMIREYGLVLLRKRGGIQHFHPCSLGTMGFLPPEDEVNWKALALQQPEETRLIPNDRNGYHFVSADITDSGRVVIRTSFLGPDSTSQTVLTMKEWQVSLSRKKLKALKFKREVVLPFPEGETPIPENIYAILDLYHGSTLSLNPDPQELLRQTFEDSLAPWDGFTIPEVMHEKHPRKEAHLVYRSRGYATSGDVSIAMYRWLISPALVHAGPESTKNNLNKKPRRATVESDSDSDSDSDSETGNSSDFHDSGYSSGGTTGESKEHHWFTTLGVKTKDKDCRWYHFKTTKTYLRQSPPVVHPTKPYTLLAIDSAKTLIVNTSTGEKRELDRSGKKHVVGRVYRFSSSGDKLYELTTTRDFEHGKPWTISIDILKFDVNEMDDIGTVAITQSESSAVSWISPYNNPFDVPDYNLLPFKITWSEKYVYLIFGACEVYIVRMSLDPQQHGSGKGKGKEKEKEENQEGSAILTLTDKPRIETTKKPIFLPASTIVRAFTYVPYPPDSSSTTPPQSPSSEKEYAVFAIAGTPELPPVVIRKDIHTDLGGWVSCDCDNSETHPKIVGKDPDAEGEDDDMKGKYSCNALTFHVPIRSGLSWDQRVVVECGAM